MKKLPSFIRKSKKKAAAAALAAAAAVFICVIVFGMSGHRDYDYIDLPIVLSNEDDVVSTIRDGLVQRKYKITISFSAEGDYNSLIPTLADDLYSKALDPTDSAVEGDYLRFQYGGYNVKYSTAKNDSGSYLYTINIFPTYYTNTSEEKAVDNAVSDFFTDVEIPPHSSDYDKVKIIHDHLCDICEYDWRNRQLAHRHKKSTAYGALVNGEASCQGYAVAMYRLLMEAGIKNRVITGDATSPETGETEYHAWNLVLLGDKWYNLDVSWDDETETYDYFLKSDASFTTHVRKEEYDDDSFRAAYPVSSDDWDKQ